MRIAPRPQAVRVYDNRNADVDYPKIYVRVSLGGPERLAALGQAQRLGLGDGLRAVLDTQLADDAMDVHFDGSRGDEQFLGDDLV